MATRFAFALVSLALVVTACATPASTAASVPATSTIVLTSTPITPTPTALVAATATPTLAYKLAIIQSGGFVAPNDPLVEQFKSGLDALQTKCIEPRARLADYAVGLHVVMAKRGVDETELSIIQHVAASIPPSAGKLQCDQVFAAYGTLRAPSQ